MCLYPRLIKNQKYVANKKNGGEIPQCHDKRVMTVPAPCGKCMECMKKKAREWQIRLQEEVRTNKNGKFITLTFSNESIKELYNIINKKKTDKITGYNIDNEIATIATRRFLERWRKKHKKSVRHWLITELGHNGTEHLHLHGIIWTDEKIEEIEKQWQYGYIWKGKETNTGKLENYVNEKTVNYLIKYVLKQDLIHKEYKPKILTSAGIGINYINRIDSKLNKYNKKGTREYYTTRTGHKIKIPTYWRNKIYSDEEKEKLWIEKINKGERWVLGEKINIKEGEENYYKALKQAQIKANRLGYQNNETDWDRKTYENERRNAKINERIKGHY